MHGRTANALSVLTLIDLTSLTDQETEEDIVTLCQQANSHYGNTAAICIYPRFIPLAKKQLLTKHDSAIKIATVVNFPHGGVNIAKVSEEVRQAVALGADEIDVVFPYKALIQGDELTGFALVKACRLACAKDTVLKVIIESGELKTPALIMKASEISIEAGADFIKTSTGKVPINATLSAADVMLNVIKNKNPNVGFKAAGGISTLEDALAYIELAEKILGKPWITDKHFRLGASGLLAHLQAIIDNKSINKSSDGY